MQVCILIASSDNNNAKLTGLAKAMARGLEENSHIVTIQDMMKSVDKLTFYDYIIIIANSTSFFGGMINPNLAKYLGQSGQVGGKRCAAFIYSNCVRKQKT